MIDGVLSLPLTMEDFNKYKDMVTASLFERYFENANDSIKETLNYQYRMHTDIMDIINIFYDEYLRDGNEDNYTYDTKGKHICLGKTEYLYEEKAVTVPLVYENKVLSKKNKIAVEWLQDVVRKNSAENIQYIALYTLPILAGNQKNCKEALLQHWETAELPEIIAELEKIHLGCIWMKTEMFQLDIFTEALIKKIDFEDYESALKSIKAIMDTNCIRKNSESHRKMVEILIEYVRVPTSYRDLFILLQSLGITTHEDALRFDDLISGLYTKTVMVDILTAIADGIYTKIPELFEYDVFFNEYQTV